MSRSDAAWTIAYADKALVVAHHGSLVVLSWRTGAGVRHVAKVRTLQRRLVAEGQAPLSVVNVFALEAKGGISEELRRSGRALYEEMVPHFFAQAYVVTGEGFWAAGIRAFLAAFAGLTARKIQTKTFSRIEDAMVWLGGLEGQRPSLRTGMKSRARQVENVVLPAHKGAEDADAPQDRTEAPTRPQTVDEEADAPVVSSRGLVSARCGPLHVSYWTSTAITRDVGRLHDDVSALAKEQRSPVGLLLYVAPGMPLCSAASRTRASVMFRQLHSVIDRVAVVSSGSGLWSMALGGALREAALILNVKINWQTFDELEPAVEWLGQTSMRWRRYMPEAEGVRGVLDSLSASTR